MKTKTYWRCLCGNEFAVVNIDRRRSKKIKEILASGMMNHLNLRCPLAGVYRRKFKTSTEVDAYYKFFETDVYGKPK